MGALSTTKFIKNNAGTLTEQYALTTSAGAGDAQAIPALNAAGILDPTIINGTITSAGAASSGKVTQLTAAGLLDTSVMPVGIGAATAAIVASEAIAAGAFVNIWDNAGVANVRNANATAAGTDANGFVLAAVLSAATATVYFQGSTNTQLSALTPGTRYYLAITAGATQSAVPTASGNVVQSLGRTQSATAMVFSPSTPFVLA